MGGVDDESVGGKGAGDFGVGAEAGYEGGEGDYLLFV